MILRGKKGKKSEMERIRKRKRREDDTRLDFFIFQNNKKFKILLKRYGNDIV